MILLVNPRATRPKNRRFPLSLMNLGAALPSGTTWEIVDGNRPTVAADSVFPRRGEVGAAGTSAGATTVVVSVACASETSTRGFTAR